MCVNVQTQSLSTPEGKIIECFAARHRLRLSTTLCDVSYTCANSCLSRSQLSASISNWSLTNKMLALALARVKNAEVP